MAVDATLTTPAPAAASVTGAIKKASRLTGTNFQYLLAAAKVESNLNPSAQAKTSSAGGLFQFIEQTWLGTLKESGAQFGYGRQADAISRNASGRFVVNDPALRREIMQLRQDPTANAVMAGAFTNANAAYLTKRLGRAPSEGELYIAHFMGAGGAAKLIGRAEVTPNAAAADAFPAAARANRSIFFGKDGRARNFVEVAKKLAGRFDVARTAPGPSDAAPTPMRTASVTETTKVTRAYEAASPKPVYTTASAGENVAVARAAPPKPAKPTVTAQGEPVFHNPYRPERSQPVAPAVAQRWTTQTIAGRQVPVLAATTKPAAVPASVQAAPAPVQSADATQAVAAATPAAKSAEPLGLFQDIKPNVRALFTGG